jgi:putative oxidoreductase
MVGYAQFKKIPNPALAVRLSGVLLLAGAAGIILGIWGDLAALLSALLLLITSITMHNFWTLEDPQAKQVDQIMFMKNIAMIGGLLVLAWAMAGTEAPLTITNGVF